MSIFEDLYEVYYQAGTHRDHVTGPCEADTLFESLQAVDATTGTDVYLHLRNEGNPRTLRQIAYETVRPQRSIRRALRQLHEEGMVSCSPRHTDPPQSEWQVNE